MTKPDARMRRRRGFVGMALAALALAFLPSVAGARRTVASAGSAAPKPFFDSRTGDPAAPAQARAGRLGSAAGRHGVASIDPRTGTPRLLGRVGGTLTGGAAADPRTTVLRYVRDHRATLGLDAGDLATLRPAGRASTTSGLTVLRWQQRFRGIPAFDDDLRAAVDRAGRVVMIGGSPVHDLRVESTAPGLSAGAALRALARNVGAPARTTAASGSVGARRATAFADGSTAALVLFAGSGGTRLAWEVSHRVSAVADYLGIVDAASGAVLYRANQTKAEEQAQVYPIYPGRPGAVNAVRTVDLEALGYLPANATRLSGKFAHTFNDINDDDTAQSGEEVPPSAGHDFLYPLVTTGFQLASHGCDAEHLCAWNSEVPTSWQTNANNDAVQLHWFLGHYHDHLAAPPIGFTDAWGNFEVGGTGGDDPVQAKANDGAATASNGGPDDDHVNNAFMDTRPDGTPPLMGMFLNRHDADFPERENNNGDDGVTVFHEYTHGLSNRLITDATGAGALDSDQSGAMGEAWSDWYAFDFASRAGNLPDTAAQGEMDLGVYSDPEPHLVRFQALDCPVGTTNSICPGTPTAGPGGFTYGDFGHVFDFPEVHSDGEIWGETLWDLRQALVADLGSEAAGSNAVERLVTDGMRLSPAEPSYLDERNAILLADQADFGGSNTNLIWSVFAHRGMGLNASTTGSSDDAPTEGFTAPADRPPAGTLSASPGAADVGQTVTLTASFRDPDSRITTYGWDFDGNGTVDQTTASPATLTRYVASGTKHPTVRVSDNRGAAGTAGATVTVGGSTPPGPPARPRYGHLAKRGRQGAYAFKVRCAATCRVKASLVVSKKTARHLGLKKRTVGHLSKRITTHRARKLKVKLTHKTIRKLKRHHRKVLKATFRVNAKYAGGRHRAAHKHVRIRR